MMLKYGWWSQESWVHHVGAGDGIDDGNGSGGGMGPWGKGGWNIRLRWRRILMGFWRL